jgi:gluconolactonase
MAASFLVPCKSTGESLVDRPVEIVKLADGFRFTEGPSVDSQGDLYFSDISNDKIYKWTEETGPVLVLQNTGHGNGIYFSPDGDLLFCEMSTRRVMGMKPGGETYILTDSYLGKRYNNPNDLWVDPAGGVYFTDPSYFLKEHEHEQDIEAVYYIPPGRDSVSRVSGHLPRLNGIIGTADGRILYVASDTIHKTWKFMIQPDGKLSEKELFVENGHDGLTLDEFGNLYIANRDSLSVDIYNPEGVFLESIFFPERPSNACFGRPGDNTLYVSAVSSVYTVRMNVGGQWD